jgi:cation:H+ antiporter
MEVGLPVAVGLFLLSALVIVVAATFLTSTADIIASKTGLGHLWVGSLLLAGATSLPELVTAVAAALAGSAELAAGDVFGANMLNMSKLTVLLALFGGYLVLQRLAPAQTWLAASAILMTGMATLFAVLKTDFRILSVSMPGVIILVTYVVVFLVLRRHSKAIEEPEGTDSSHSLRWAWTIFGLCALLILLAGPLLAVSAQRVADLTGIASSFMGVLALAFVTSLPELTSAFTAIRIGAPNLAVATIYGTNSFNIVALGVADLFYSDGKLFSDLGAGTVSAGLFAILLTGLGMLQLVLRRPLKRFSLTEPTAPLFLGLYILGLFVVFYLG